MPPGDASRVWFPEMIDVLRTEWRPSIPMVELVALAQRLDEMVHRIRTSRQIKAPLTRCRRCGYYGRVERFRVSVRATILAARRFGITDEQNAKDIEKRWKKYREKHRLDLYGRVEALPADSREH